MTDATPEQPIDAGPRLSENLAARKVWHALFRERGWLRRVVVATCLINLLAVSMSLFAMQVYDRVVPTLAYATLTTLVAGMVIVIVFDWLLKTLRARTLDSLASAVDRQLSQEVYEHLLHLRLDAQPRSLGTLAAQVSSLEAVRQFFSSAVVFALIDLPFALMFLAFIAVIGGKVAWVYTLLLPAALILGFASQWRLRRLMREQIQRANERQGLLVDSIRGAEAIRASNAGTTFGDQWREVTGSINRYTLRQRAINSLTTVTTSSLSMSAYVSAVIVGVWQIEAGLLTMGGLIACSILGGRIIAPVAQSAQYLVQWQQVSQSLRLVHEVLKLPSERRAEQTLLTPTTEPKHISLEQVRFGYPGAQILQLSIDHLTLNSGDRALLLGPVGSGKSTLLKVLTGLYPPVEGRVRLGDADLWEIDPRLVARQIGYLPQQPQLFRGTLRSNLQLGNDCSDDELLALCRDLGINAIVDNNPQGLDLPISEGGDGLSGGQRQLVALARLILARPRVWLLDEPGAGLDRETEERAWQCIQNALNDDDILVVSTHRPMMAASIANRAMTIASGTIQRDGKPEAVLPMLMAKRPPTGNSRREGGFDVL